MKGPIRYTILLLTIGLVIGMSGCKKDTLLRTYYCAMHNIVFGPPGYNTDTIIGYATISVYQSGTQVTMNNETLNLTSNTNGTVTYQSPTGTNPGAGSNQMVYYNNAIFVNNFDSMVYVYNYNIFGVYGGTYSSYQGHQIN